MATFCRALISLLVLILSIALLATVECAPFRAVHQISQYRTKPRAVSPVPPNRISSRSSPLLIPQVAVKSLSSGESADDEDYQNNFRDIRGGIVETIPPMHLLLKACAASIAGNGIGALPASVLLGHMPPQWRQWLMDRQRGSSGDDSDNGRTIDSRACEMLRHFGQLVELEQAFDDRHGSKLGSEV